MPTRTIPKNRRDTAVPYIDYERDARDCDILDAINAALLLMAEDDMNNVHRAASVLRLARARLESSWPITETQFTGEVRHA